MSFPAHKSYMDSGLDWMGAVPDHWRLAPFWSLFRRTKRTGFPDAELLSVYRDYGVIRKADRDDNFNNASEDLSTYQLVEPGDLAMNKMKAWQGSLGVSAHRGIVSPAYFVFQAQHAEDPAFLHYLLRSAGYAVGFMTISKGIRIGQWDLDPDHLGTVPIPLPPLAEQRAISAFLDRETAKIDALVEAQERLIALLKEKRQAVISHAVTKGLDPSAPMKDSGVEWLGQVPSHWEVLRLKDLTMPTDGIQMGPFGGMLKDLLTEPTGFKVYGQENVTNGDFERGSRWIDAERFAELGGYHLRVGDLMLTRKGSVGNCCIFPDTAQRGIIDSDTIRISLAPSSMDRRFALRILHEASYVSTQIDLTKRGAILAGLNTTVVSNLVIVTPPLHDQIELVERLNAETAKFDALVAQSEAAITLLQERRAALISAAVTGKIDVRSLVQTAETA